LLRCFHTLNLQGRVPAYDFYNALEILSERAGMRDLPVCHFSCKVGVH
jgi:hypothetical protein